MSPRKRSSKTFPIIQSAGGIVYRMDVDNKPRYLLIKRHALSKKIERVCPKGKLERGETKKQAALREVGEETGLATDHLQVYHELGVTKLRNTNNVKGMMNKDTTYFLMEYTGPRHAVDLEDGGGFVGVHKWALFHEVLGLVYYQDIREIIRKAHKHILENK